MSIFTVVPDSFKYSCNSIYVEGRRIDCIPAYKTHLINFYKLSTGVLFEFWSIFINFCPNVVQILHKKLRKLVMVCQ